MFPKDKGPDREYFFNIVNTVQGEFLQKMIDHANKQRNTTEGERGQKEAIKISEFWEEMFKKMPYKSSKCRQCLIVI